MNEILLIEDTKQKLMIENCEISLRLYYTLFCKSDIADIAELFVPKVTLSYVSSHA